MGDDVKCEQCATGGWYCHVGTLSVRRHGENWLQPMNCRGWGNCFCLLRCLKTWLRVNRDNCSLIQSGTRLQMVSKRSHCSENSAVWFLTNRLSGAAT